MLKHTILCLCLLVGSAFAQTHTEDTLEDAQTVSGAKTFSGLATFAGAVNIGASANGKIVYLTVPVGSDIGAQANLACANNPSGAWIIFPPGTYDVKTAITGCSNSVFMGAGIDNTILEGNVLSTTLGANPVFNLQNISNITVTGFTCRNGTAQTSGYTAGENCIYHNGNSNAWIYGNKFTEIQGDAATQERASTNIHIFNNYYFRSTFLFDSVLNDNVGIYFHNNYGDTLTCGLGNCQGNSYAVSQGYDATPGTNYVKGYYVEDNFFKNGPNWSCLDTHGGDEIHFERNHCENFAIGLTAQAAAKSYITNQTLSHLYVKDNTFIQGTGDTTTHGNFGLSVEGNVGEGVPATDVQVTGNNFTGFGASQGGGNGQVVVMAIKNTNRFTVADNTCSKFNQACVGLINWNQNGVVARNHAVDMAGAASAGTSAAIAEYSTGNFNISFDGNTLEAPSGAAFEPNAMFRAVAVPGGDGGLQFINNRNLTSTPTYSNQADWPVEKAALPTAATGMILKYGDSVLTSGGQLGWTVNTSGVSSSKTGLGSLDSVDTVILGDCATGSNVIHNLTSQTFLANATSYFFLPEGMNIVLTGCGPAAANLNATVLSNIAQSQGGGIVSTPGGCSVTANVATCTTNSTHNILSGQTVYVQNVQGGAVSFDGIFVTTAASGTTFSYALTAGNQSSTSSPVATVSTQALTLDQNASTTAAQAAILYQPATFSAFAVDGTGRVFVNQNGIAILGGGTTSSFSGLRFNGTTLQAVLADNSAFTTFQMRGLTVTENSALSGLGGSDLLWGDSTAHRLKTNPNNTGATTLAAFTDNLGVFASGGTITPAAYASSTNCAVNSVSPAACAAAAAGAFVVPTTTTTYTVNTTAVTAASRIFLMPMSFAGNLPSAPTCVTPAITSSWSISAITAATSFTFALPSTAGQTCWQYWIVD